MPDLSLSFADLEPRQRYKLLSPDRASPRRRSQAKRASETRPGPRHLAA